MERLAPGAAVTWRPWLVAFFVCTGLLAVTNESFWIDEFATFNNASLPTLKECWRSMRHARIPEIQAPLYMAYMWGWIHLFGSGEWTMRMGGLPLFAGGACAFTYFIGRALGNVPIVALICGFSPFAWYYLNEARPYAFQLGFALGALGGAVEVVRTAGSQPSRAGTRVLAVCLVGLCGANVIGAICGACLFFAVLVSISRRHWRAVLGCAPIVNSCAAVLLTALAGYYCWTMTIHPKPTAVGRTTWQTFVFIFYEILGALGAGAGRNSMREHGPAALKPFIVPVSIYLSIVIFHSIAGLRALLDTLGRLRFLIGVATVAIPVIVMTVVGIQTDFRVVGRHLTAIAPSIFAILSAGAIVGWRLGGVRRVAAVVLIALWISSAATIRLAPWHKRDDYRTAMRIARNTAVNGATVWWTADFGGLSYYAATNGDSQHIIPLVNASATDVQRSPKPVLIILSKPDTYDANGSVTRFIAQYSYTLKSSLRAFSLWAPPSKEPSTQ